MAFDLSCCSAAVREILALDGLGAKIIPLTREECSPAPAGAAIRAAPARQLFPEAHAPEAALAGLYLYFSCWDEAHETAQNIATPEGSYWHAIVHRQEPDDWNSGYWFRQVGEHAIFPRLAGEAALFGIGNGKTWDPAEFIKICAKARREPGGDLQQRALEVQRVEWQLLFAYCATKTAVG